MDEEEDDDEEDDTEDEEEEQPEVTFVFDPVDPLRIKLAENGFIVIIRTALKLEGKDDIPPTVITIPINFDLVGNQIRTEYQASESKISVSGPRFRAVTSAAQIKRILDARLAPREFDLKSIELPVENKASLYLSITDFFSSNGWLTISASQ